MIAEPTATTPRVHEPTLELGLDKSAPAGAGLPPDRLLAPGDTFVRRHIGPDQAELAAMLGALGLGSLEELVAETVPAGIRRKGALQIGGKPRGEKELLDELRGMMRKNLPFRSFIGCGYHDTITPPVIQRNIIENPGWYTQYTPYQAEISQGRLEALLNFQTMVCDLTGLPLANASLLDEATAAAEAMYMVLSHAGTKAGASFWVADDVHPHVRAVVQTRATPIGVKVLVGSVESIDCAALAAQGCAGLLVSYPATDGRVRDLVPLCAAAKAANLRVVVDADLLSLALLTPPGEVGADCVIGSTQRFGVPLGCGGPHAAFMATRQEFERKLPGRIVGVSKDNRGKRAIRLALQTREQHIRRDKATSNICTAQVLLAVMAGLYACYHGPDGLRAIATRIHGMAVAFQDGLRRLGLKTGEHPLFDTVRVNLDEKTAKKVTDAAKAKKMNLRELGGGALCVAFDEVTTAQDVTDLLECFALGKSAPSVEELVRAGKPAYAAPLARTSSYLGHAVFNRHHGEHELLRYMHRLQSRDLSLTTSMIALGSCTMKLNGTVEMFPVTWPEVGKVHPFAPQDQLEGYKAMFAQLEGWLNECTGFAATSLQPNAGSQGEYAGLLVIRAYHEDRGQGHRDVCLIPTSAHGTNPATATLAGMRVVTVACDEQGNVDLEDLRRKADEHKDKLAALMITYPSTHGVFEEGIQEICQVVHERGGQIYMDGANMNAQVGLCRPGDFGADVCHLNLHKTFCIPHGGGGPGMGPICVAKHLAPYLPGHPLWKASSAKATSPVSAAPFGSPSILVIPWVYIALMGGPGLTLATKTAILSANYMARRLEGHYPVLYTNARGRCAHEFILDCRAFKESAGVTVEDVAKRLMDYGFHAPTVSFPVAGTLMVEPTESESKAELDRFCDALISIREEIRAIEDGKADKVDNPLKNAPHTMDAVVSSTWTHPYTREEAAFPAPWTREHKFWPFVGRIDGVGGDRHLICTCPPTDAYSS